MEYSKFCSSCLPKRRLEGLRDSQKPHCVYNRGNVASVFVVTLAAKKKCLSALDAVIMKKSEMHKFAYF